MQRMSAPSDASRTTSSTPGPWPPLPASLAERELGAQHVFRIHERQHALEARIEPRVGSRCLAIKSRMNADDIRPGLARLSTSSARKDRSVEGARSGVRLGRRRLRPLIEPSSNATITSSLAADEDVRLHLHRRPCPRGFRQMMWMFPALDRPGSSSRPISESREDETWSVPTCMRPTVGAASACIVVVARARTGGGEQREVRGRRRATALREGLRWLVRGMGPPSCADACRPRRRRYDLVARAARPPRADGIGRPARRPPDPGCLDYSFRSSPEVMRGDMPPRRRSRSSFRLLLHRAAEVEPPHTRASATSAWTSVSRSTDPRPPRIADCEPRALDLEAGPGRCLRRKYVCSASAYAPVKQACPDGYSGWLPAAKCVSSRVGLRLVVAVGVRAADRKVGARKL